MEGSGGRGREGVGVINEVIEAGNRSLSHPSLMTRPELHCLRRGHFVMGVVSNVRQKRRHPFSPPIYVTFLNILIQDDAEETRGQGCIYIYISSQQTFVEKRKRFQATFGI